MLALGACTDGGLSEAPIPATVEDTPDPLATIVESGFGQDGATVWIVAVVSNAPGTVGLGVTVRFRLLDKRGKVLATTTQEERFSWEGQHLPVAKSVKLPQRQDPNNELWLLPPERVKTVETSMTTRLTGTPSAEPFEPFEGRLGPKKLGDPRVFYSLDNPSEENRARLRISEVCRDAAGRIIGGSTTTPVTIRPGSTAHIWSIVTVSSEPMQCTVYPAPETGTPFPANLT
jgi:hypothetical protein